MDVSPSQHGRGSCPLATRIGVGRSLAFGALSAGVPAIAHGASGFVALAAIFALAAVFAAWSWRTRCTPRSAASLASTLVAGQLVVHAVLVLTAIARASAPAASAATGSIHVHGAPDDGAALAGIAVMAAIHLLAVVYGVIVLLSLERRALRFVATCIRRIDDLIGLGTDFTPERAARLGQCASLVEADDADARRARRLARSHARRGPPCRHAHPLVAA